MKRNFLRIISISFALCDSTVLLAQDRLNPIITAVPFLRISTDARASGMGDVGIATAPNVNAAYWNPGKISFNTERSGIAAFYSPWLRDISSDMFLGAIKGYAKLDSNQSIHSSFRYFNLGSIQFTDDNGNHLQTYKPKEWALDLGYSRKLSEQSGLGLTFRYINSQLSSKSASDNEYNTGQAFSVDLGYYYDAKDSRGNGWMFGGALTNLGSKIDYSKTGGEKDFIPANLGLGTSFTKLVNEQNRISFGLDINKLLVPSIPLNADSAAMVSYRNKSVIGSWFSSFGDASGGFSEELKEIGISAGAEYSYNNEFALRAGYFYENKLKGDRNFFTVGAGLKYNIVGLDFAYLFPTGNNANQNPLSNTLRFSIQFDLNKNKVK